MSLLRTLARPLLAAVFIVDGWDAMRHPERHAKNLEPTAKPLTSVPETVPGMPKDTLSLARAGGGLRVVAGGMLAAGRMPRLAGAALAGAAVPVALANRPQGQSAEERREDLSTFLRKVGLVGGLIFAAGDRRGEPSLRWKRQNAKTHRAELSELKSDLKSEVKAAKAA